MTDVKRLLKKATPLPWRDDGYMDYGHTDTFGCNIKAGESGDYATSVTWAGVEGLEGAVPNHADAALIVHAVNHLPAYETAIEALERLINVGDALWDDHPPVWMSEADDAREALRRLRDEVPA